MAGVALITTVKCFFPQYLNSYASSNAVRQVYGTGRGAKELNICWNCPLLCPCHEANTLLQDSPEGSLPARNSERSYQACDVQNCVKVSAELGCKHERYRFVFKGAEPVVNYLRPDWSVFFTLTSLLETSLC